MLPLSYSADTNRARALTALPSGCGGGGVGGGGGGEEYYSKLLGEVCQTLVHF